MYNDKFTITEILDIYVKNDKGNLVLINEIKHRDKEQIENSFLNLGKEQNEK